MNKGDELAKEYFLTRNDKLRGEIVKQYSAMCADIIRKKFYNENNFDDLMQEGALAVLKALEKFNPELATFTTLAGTAIRNNIIMYLKKNNIFGTYKTRYERESAAVLEYMPAKKTVNVDIVDTVNNVFKKMDKTQVKVLKRAAGMSSGKDAFFEKKKAQDSFKKIATRWNLQFNDFFN